MGRALAAGACCPLILANTVRSRPWNCTAVGTYNPGGPRGLMGYIGLSIGPRTGVSLASGGGYDLTHTHTHGRPSTTNPRITHPTTTRPIEDNRGVASEQDNSGGLGLRKIPQRFSGPGNGLFRPWAACPVTNQITTTQALLTHDNRTSYIHLMCYSGQGNEEADGARGRSPRGPMLPRSRRQYR